MSRDRTRRLDFLPLISEDPEDEDNDFEQIQFESMQCRMGDQRMADLQRMDMDVPGSKGSEEHI